jgi:hypothetical protein
MNDVTIDHKKQAELTVQTPVTDLEAINNKTQYFIIDKIKIICNNKSWFIHHLITQLKCCCEQRRNKWLFVPT